MKGVIRNHRKGGPNPNNSRPKGAAPIAQSLNERDLQEAYLQGNRATRRLALRNLKRRLKAASGATE